MPPVLLPHSPYALIAVSALIIVLPALAYLVALRPRTPASWSMIAFLLCVVGSVGSMFAFNALAPLFIPLWPLQDIWLLAGVAFLIRLAYQLPPTADGAARRAMRWLSGGALLLTAALAVWLALATRDFLRTGGAFAIPPAFWLVNPLVTLLAAGVFAHRAGGLRALRHPPTPAAAAQRNFALAILSGLVQAFGSLSYPLGLRHLVPTEAVVGIGTMLTLTLIVLAYLQAARAQHTLIVRHVSVALLIVLGIVCTIGIQVLNTASQNIQTALKQEIALYSVNWLAGVAAPPANLAYIATYPVAPPPAAADIRLTYVAADLPAAQQARLRTYLPDTIAAQPLLDSVPRIANEDRRYETRFVAALPVRGDDYYSWNIIRDGQVTEFALRDPLTNAASHALVTRILAQLIIGALIVLVVLPLFYRRSLTQPLNALLGGVQRLNAGDLAAQVPAAGDDEIAYLTRSFNAMITSLRELNEGLEQKVAERTQALEVARANAEAANRAKSEFLARMSHELRTPLNAILGYAQLLQRDYPHDEKGAIIERSGSDLLRLINGVLDLARVEAGKITLEPQPLALDDFLAGLITTLRRSALDKGLTLTLDATLPADLVVLADAARLRQVLLNLLANAIAYTARGSVTLHASAVSGAAVSGANTPVQIAFAVSDTGSGIDPLEQTRIMEPFYQGAAGRRRAGSTGLGLSICRDLLALMDSTLTVDSTPGVGSRFGFTLTLPRVAALPPALPPIAPAPPPAYYRLPGGGVPHIVIVDDHADNRDLLGELLQPLGFGLTMAADGATALALALAQPPDAVITDIVMDGLDGYALIAALRADPRTAGCLIIALSASAYAADAARAQAAGADDFMPKPVDLARLLARLVAALALESAAPSTAHPPAPTLHSLLQLARAGDVLALQHQLDALAQQPALQPFVAQARAFSARFAMSELSAWLATLVAADAAEVQAG